MWVIDPQQLPPSLRQDGVRLSQNPKATQTLQVRTKTRQNGLYGKYRARCLLLL